jgi:hypothetical protein
MMATLLVTMFLPICARRFWSNHPGAAMHACATRNLSASFSHCTCPSDVGWVEAVACVCRNYRAVIPPPPLPYRRYRYTFEFIPHPKLKQPTKCGRFFVKYRRNDNIRQCVVLYAWWSSPSSGACCQPVGRACRPSGLCDLVALCLREGVSL